MGHSFRAASKVKWCVRGAQKREQPCLLGDWFALGDPFALGWEGLQRSEQDIDMPYPLKVETGPPLVSLAPVASRVCLSALPLPTKVLLSYV